MVYKKFDRLVKRGVLSREELEKLVLESQGADASIEARLKRRGIPKHEILFCLSEYYGLPFVEYDEGIIISQQIIRRMDMERMKHALWLPLSIMEDKAEVIACRPESLVVLADIKKTLGVHAVAFRVALPSDLVRIIEHNQDVNPGFPPSAGRTPLAKTRTMLANMRSAYSCFRTDLARGRTGLAMLRTGISFITMAVLLLRVFGFGYLAIGGAVLLAAGVAMVADGLLWYLPIRKTDRKRLNCRPTTPTWGTSILYVSNPGESPVFERTSPVEGAARLREGWHDLTPVMRR